MDLRSRNSNRKMDDFQYVAHELRPSVRWQGVAGGAGFAANDRIGGCAKGGIIARKSLNFLNLLTHPYMLP
jgi:hypothetical protein